MKLDLKGLLVVERILRDRQGLWRQILDQHRLGELIGQMVLSSTLALACYGAVIGASSTGMQTLSSAVKLPVLFLVTLGICLPTLYLFNLVFGSRLSVTQALSLIMVAVTVTAALSLAFAPISLFFLVTAPNYAFYKILNVAILGLTALVGLRFLVNGMRSMNEMTAERAALAEAATHAEWDAEEYEGARTPALVGAAGAADPAASSAVPATAATPANGAFTGQVGPAYHPGAPAAAGSGHRPVNMTLLYVWVAVFGFVGTQLAWTLRPFVGSPGQPFEVFRSIEGNFYVDVVRTLGVIF